MAVRTFRGILAGVVALAFGVGGLACGGKKDEHAGHTEKPGEKHEEKDHKK
ncbi:MAG: hypothetical protein L0216_11855 [Planctomycetales bacterium]|nr:hypothetical protein [Planctomycetales bacterium]